MCLIAVFWECQTLLWMPSREATPSTDWILHPDVFRDLQSLDHLPLIDLFVSPVNTKVPLFLSRLDQTVAGRPDVLTFDWRRWSSVHLLLLSNTSTLLRVYHKLEGFQGQVLLIAPFWLAQPWFHRPQSWCPSMCPLPPGVSRYQCSLNLYSVEFLERVLTPIFGEGSARDFIHSVRTSMLHQHQSCWCLFQEFVHSEGFTSWSGHCSVTCRSCSIAGAWPLVLWQLIWLRYLTLFILDLV